MPYPTTIPPTELLKVCAKASLLSVQARLLLLQSMLGVSANGGISLLHLIPLDFYRTEHLQTELLRQYGYEFILVPPGVGIVCDEGWHYPRVYLTISANSMQYVTTRMNGQESTRGTIVRHGFPVINTLVELEPHLPRIMQAFGLGRYAIDAPIQVESATRLRHAVLGLVVFYMFMKSLEQMKQDPLMGSLGLLAQLFLWCSVDLELPKKLYVSVLPQVPLRTEVYAALQPLEMAFMLNVLSSEMLCAMVLFNVFFNNRTRVQNRLIEANVIPNPNVDFQEQQIWGDNILIAVAENHSFYFNALLAIGFLSATICLLALTGCVTLPTSVIVATATVAAVVGIGLFVAKKHPAIIRGVIEHPGLAIEAAYNCVYQTCFGPV